MAIYTQKHDTSKNIIDVYSDNEQSINEAIVWVNDLLKQNIKPLLLVEAFHNYTGIIKQTAEQFIALGCREHMPAHEYFSVGYGRVYEQVTESQKNILIIKYIRI